MQNKSLATAKNSLSSAYFGYVGFKIKLEIFMSKKKSIIHEADLKEYANQEIKQIGDILFYHDKYS